MMDKKGNLLVGAALTMAFFIFVLVLFATITPFKQTLDDARDTTALNCRGTTGFNQTAFDLDTTDTSNIPKLTRRPTCFITGIGMVWFVISFLAAAVTWLARQWVGGRRRA